MNTLNYSEINKAFMSFLSSNPKWYLNFKGGYYYFDESNTLFRANNGSKYNALKSETPDRSLIKTVTNKDYVSTKVFDNVKYFAEFSGSDNFDNIEFYTSTQTGNAISKNDIDKREDTYKFAIPRRVGTDQFADRLKGKFLISVYKFQSSDGNMFSVPFIETTYRYSNI